MWQQNVLSAGPVIYPLILCSVCMVMLILERLISLLRYRSFLDEECLEQFKSNNINSIQDGKSSLSAPSSAQAGLQLLSFHRHFSKPLRDEVVSQWLEEQRQFLHGRIRWLHIVAGVAPLLGLLGTVLGIIDMFQDVSQQAGPVTPAVLASGMWEAMATTALGLVIAIPAMIAAQAFSIWGDNRLERMAAALNHCSLWLEKEWEGGQLDTGSDRLSVIESSTAA